MQLAINSINRASVTTCHAHDIEFVISDNKFFSQRLSLFHKSEVNGFKIKHKRHHFKHITHQFSNMNNNLMHDTSLRSHCQSFHSHDSPWQSYDSPCHSHDSPCQSDYSSCQSHDSSRLSIHGWFHWDTLCEVSHFSSDIHNAITAPDESCTPYTFINLINPLYLDPDVQLKVANLICSQGNVMLSSFLTDEF
ncbi:hypothetical protein GJ496_002631 [Pomphorhynchus laevis]|nr:hypothetical protein GJ496_002631 [Pomphorhynchus laevis]